MKKPYCSGLQGRMSATIGHKKTADFGGTGKWLTSLHL